MRATEYGYFPEVVFVCLFQFFSVIHNFIISQSEGWDLFFSSV